MSRARIEMPGRDAHVRRGMIAKLHVAKKQLHLDDDLYRTVLKRVTGHDSAAELSAVELDAVLNEFRRLGFQPAPARAAKAKRLADSPQVKLARALWIGLFKAGAIADGSERALAKFGERLTGVAALHWMMPAQLNQVIESLKGWTKRLQEPAAS